MALATATGAVPWSSKLMSAAVLQLCGQGLPCISDTDPLPLRVLVATLNCLLMWSFCVCLQHSLEVQEVNQAASKMALEVCTKISDWSLKSSGATIDMRRTSKTYHCRENLGCRVLAFLFPSKPPDTILQPDVSPGNCWPFQGHQGQVVIRLPARVHLTGITMQHIYEDVSPSGTVISAPRDIAVFGVDADGEEETLLGMFTYNVEKEAIQTFLLKDAPFPRAFSYIKLLVKSNWGNPAYTCIYRVQVHGKMAKPEGLI
ncbi:sperm-associated antigen 4 protein-like [Porphyrio hochstetteri]